MNLILHLLNTCWFFHRWANKCGGLASIRSAERGKLLGEVLYKNPDGGWYRHERWCIRCGRREYLRMLNEDGTKADWERL